MPTVVLLYLLCGSYAHAGLMVRVGPSDAAQIDASRGVSAVSADQMPSQEDDRHYESGVETAASDFAAMNLSSSGSSGASAAVAELASLPHVPGLQWLLMIMNSSLPPQPFLDGLRRPS